MIKAYAITGPTASGKTALSLEVAKRLGCEIISMDSMQIYRGMDIGTAKATAEERAIAPHHCLDLLDPPDTFSANAYKEIAKAAALDIERRGKIPLFVGGTGLYLSTLLRPECESAPESRREYRERIEASLKTEEDRIALWEKLRSIDPESAVATHYNNVRRVIRALEIFDRTGKTKTYFDRLTRETAGEFDILHLTIDIHSRETLYKRIDNRVDIMVKEGLFEEVLSLYNKGLLPPESTAAQAIGYKEIIECLERGEPEDAATDRIKQASRNLAKRQLTWFRHMAGARALYLDTEDGAPRAFADILNEAIDYFKNKE